MLVQLNKHFCRSTHFSSSCCKRSRCCSSKSLLWLFSATTLCNCSCWSRRFTISTDRRLVSCFLCCAPISRSWRTGSRASIGREEAILRRCDSMLVARAAAGGQEKRANDLGYLPRHGICRYSPPTRPVSFQSLCSVRRRGDAARADRADSAVRRATHW